MKPNNFLCYDGENFHVKRQRKTFIVHFLATGDTSRRANVVRRKQPCVSTDREALLLRYPDRYKYFLNNRRYTYKYFFDGLGVSLLFGKAFRTAY